MTDPVAIELDEHEVAAAANKLNAVIRLYCDELATTLVNEAALRAGSEAPIGASPVTGTVLIAWELAKLRIRREAKVDHEQVVVAARAAGATWEEIGATCGITRQAACDRWGKMVKERAAQLMPVRTPDALDQFNPSGQREEGQARRRRYVRKPKTIRVRKPRRPV